MVKLLIVLCLMSFTLAGPTWLTNMKEAKSEALQSNKLILLNFSGSDWCGPCIRLRKEIFESETFANYAGKNLILVNADFPRYKKNQLAADQVKENEALADKYNSSGKFPFTVLMDANGKILKQWDGFPGESPEKFTEEINSFSHAGN